MINATRKLTLFLAALLTATAAMAQTTYQSVGIIGSATAKGWLESTPMTLTDSNNKHQWSITLSLTQNEVKFRADNAWIVNWGSTAFPAGVGTRDGSNVVVATSGMYTVQFNDITGAYQFTKQTTTATQAAAELTLLKLTVAPNPARTVVRVAYELPAAATATITVQNLLGQTVRQLAPIRQGAGSQEQPVSLQGLAPGIYLVQLHTGTHVQTARLLVE
ncbi:T9SS type A sorting domain-containing protein [Hymenobacter elongatus]|nr:T9SS type A sorting domain-containing protein [Hymenobacter elongatus]